MTSVRRCHKLQGRLCLELSREPEVSPLPSLPCMGWSRVGTWSGESRHLTNQQGAPHPWLTWEGEADPGIHLSEGLIWHRREGTGSQLTVSETQSQMPGIPLQGKWNRQLPLILQKEGFSRSHLYCSGDISWQMFLSFWGMLTASTDLLVTAQLVPHCIFPPGCCDAPGQDTAFAGSLLEPSLGLNQSSR